MARGMYVSVDGYSSVDQGDWIKTKSRGSEKKYCDLDRLFNFWTPTKPAAQLVQVAPGFKWCYQCGDVRPVGYFSPDPRNKRDGLDGRCKGCEAERKRMARQRTA